MTKEEELYARVLLLRTKQQQMIATYEELEASLAAPILERLRNLPWTSQLRRTYRTALALTLKLERKHATWDCGQFFDQVTLLSPPDRLDVVMRLLPFILAVEAQAKDPPPP